ncbi:Heat shock transcription factor [Hamiltosporidium tvaerminnensis]|nr:Heat shock transcription factor [Hamiltosporidium tvaerminnensis]
MFGDKKNYYKFKSDSVPSRHKPIAEFVDKLYNMVQDNLNEPYIRWNSDGKSFIIIHPPEFARCILENYFKHANLSSFVRQLNKYHFHKIKSSENIIEAFGSQVWEFRNPDFQKNRPDLLTRIKRKRSSNERSFRSYYDTGSNIVDQTSMMQDQILGTLKVITRYFQVIIEDLNEIKKFILHEKGLQPTIFANILLAEDNVTCSTYASVILKKIGCAVTIAESEDDIMEKLSGDKFDMVIFSLGLPNINSVVRSLRQYDNSTIIIAISEGLSKEECVSFLSLGINEILIKPYHHDALVQLINNYCNPKRRTGAVWKQYGISH